MEQKSTESMLERMFSLKENSTNAKTEFIAGTTTFVAMSYILFVNPSVLAAAGMDQGAVFVATALSAILGCLTMAFAANYPIAIAPSLGSNAFFAYSVVIGMHIKWQTALAGVFAASILFMLVTIFKLREKVINAIPSDLKSAIAAGVGLFVAFVGMKGGGLVVPNKSTIISITNFHDPTVWLTIFGLVLTVVLFVRNVPGSMLIGMLATSILGISFGLIKMPSHVISTIPSLKPTFGQAIIHLNDIFNAQMVTVTLIFFLVVFFDTTGTVVGFAEQAGFIKHGEKVSPRVGKALFSDAVGMMGGSVLGTSPTATFVESSAGIAVGGRTGLTAITIAGWFFVSMFFSPLLSVVTSQVTAPILIIVGASMAQSIGDINWHKFDSAFPAFITMVSMILFYNISYGLAIGAMTYPIVMLAEGKGKKVSPIMYGAFFVFLFLMYAMNKAS